MKNNHDEPDPLRVTGTPDKDTMKTWSCKIGEIGVTVLPDGSDWPMRRAVEQAYRELTGESPKFAFSGWGAELTEAERDVADCTCLTWPHKEGCSRFGKPVPESAALDLGPLSALVEQWRVPVTIRPLSEPTRSEEALLLLVERSAIDVRLECARQLETALTALRGSSPQTHERTK